VVEEERRVLGEGEVPHAVHPQCHHTSAAHSAGDCGAISPSTHSGVNTAALTRGCVAKGVRRPGMWSAASQATMPAKRSGARIAISNAISPDMDAPSRTGFSAKPHAWRKPRTSSA
jgi:hypothetical protein